MTDKQNGNRVDTKEAKKRLDGFIAECRSRKIRLTPQRLGIYREVAYTKKHPDAESVFKGVRRKFPGISRDTVYRTLYSLEQEGFISRLTELCHGVRFDADMEEHHHFVCCKCGSVHDFSSRVLNHFRAPASLREVGKVSSAHLELRGLCSKCGRSRSLH